MQKNQNKILSLVLALMMLFSLAACNNSNSDKEKITQKPQTTQESKTTKESDNKKATKTINVTVVKADDSKKTFTIDTKEKNLRGALEQEKLVKGEKREYGLFIKTVDGYTVDDSKEEWWCITKDGAYVETGVDSTPIEDGDNFELTLKAGY